MVHFFISDVLKVVNYYVSIYNRFISKDEKKKVVEKFTEDIKELENERRNSYPRVVQDAIDELIRRYNQDIEYLKKVKPKKTYKVRSQVF